MAVVLLVRHGQASWGAADYDVLSQLGAAQGRRLGMVLAGRGIRPARLIAGTMRRHASTAAALVEAAGWPLRVEGDAGWDEFDHERVLAVHGPPDGVPEGQQLTRQQFDAWFDAAAARWAGGQTGGYDESFATFTERVDAALQRITAGLGSGDTAVVVSSGGPVSWVAATLLGGGVDLWLRLNPVTVNASVTKLVVGRRGTTLVSVNEHGHLEPDLVTYR